MSPRLRNLLLVVGTVTVAGLTARVAIPEQGTTRAELLDAGVAECPRRHLVCDVRVSEDGRNRLADAGVSVSRKYVPMRVRGRLCDDVWVVPASGAMRNGISDIEVMRDSCEAVAADGVDFPAFEVAASRCLAAPADGGTLCQRSERDGGYRYFGASNAMPRGESNGHASCVPVACTVHAGEVPE